MRKSGKSERQKLVAKLDKAFSEYIRARDGYRCVTCGTVGREKDGVIQCGHLFTRASYSTRWSDENAFAQCRGCNLRHEHDAAPFTMFYLNRFGQVAYEKLYLKHKSVFKITNCDIQTLIGIYEKKKAELTNV
jgi:5-methylcytosine-specific restriction endonuclease McrA